MKITKENLKVLVELEEAFEDKVLEVLNKKCKLETGLGYEGDRIIKISYGTETIEVVTEVYSGCSCCSDETEYYELPTSYLFDEKWQEEVERKIKEKQEIEERKEQERVRKQKEEREVREREEFKRLKIKFEGE